MSTKATKPRGKTASKATAAQVEDKVVASAEGAAATAAALDATQPATSDATVSEATGNTPNGGRKMVMHVRSLLPTGHRRGGRRWGPESVPVDTAEFGEDDLQAIATDPRLHVALEEQ
ncbi:MAG: hypothetical protein CGU28_03140 [Candidatus Dactylopiibacterium carminicum]|uniref:Mu-like prophage FluMu N-terminal domain-containing protein n=1 Tax=Candidatus Dactylopiibacterium carminicum TaxID=857335 RepID=A0ABQ7HTY2_9RHOO|nr:hypothetical protein [Candidatus Dactylopiibacterium carminicum]KAF7600620.1 hypothetical protein BGI27_01685 [Candidatus Dactylopiibacterium carminicum]PAS97949.1 MAG: hypothetical protein CGU28_03140 [Candidatus Dactylopiibacterium carminicum]PAT00618.1 MAG: hypothetical protein BSR46_01695 [Candidatus Dactylopiibacterium carminicum]